MKKVKFTLGIMLSALLLGANVVNAASYDNTKPYRHTIDYSVDVKANPFYNSIRNNVVNNLYETFPINGNGYDLGAAVDYNAYADSIITLRDTTIAYDSISYQFLAPNRVGIHETQRIGADFNNEFIIALNYRNGNELMPIIRQTIVIGEWYTEGDSVNKMRPTGVVIPSYMLAKSNTFRPDQDRKNGVAIYTYNESILDMAKKYNIYSISYTISVYDEIGIPGAEAYDPPVMIEPVALRRMTFDIEPGIITNIPDINVTKTIYVPRYCTFNVFSATKPNVTTDRDDTKNEGKFTSAGVDVVSKGNNIYAVTIKDVTKPGITVKVESTVKTNSADGEDGQTGNEGPTVTGDAVWASGGTLYVNAATPGMMNIYSVTGQLYKTEYVSGSFNLSLPKGLYLVQLNGKTYKVIL